VAGRPQNPDLEPPDLVEAIACHHHPFEAVDNPELTAIVHLSDAVTLQMGMGLGLDGLMYPLSEDSMNLLGVSQGDLEILMADIVDIFIDQDVF